MKQRGFVWLPLLLVLFCVLVTGGGAYYLTHQTSTLAEPISQESTTVPTPKTINETKVAEEADSAVAPSVPGMSKYTDSDFGFSFWYPSNWSVYAEFDGDAFIGFPVTKRWVIYDTDHKQRMQIKGFSFDRLDFSSVAGGCITTDYYQDDKGWQETSISCGVPNAVKSYDHGFDTMGGLPSIYYQYASTIIKYIVPLSATKPVQGLVVDAGAQSFNMLPLIRTIVATDLSVATTTSVTNQIKVIQAEKEAYSW